MLRYAPAERIIYQLLDSDAATFGVRVMKIIIRLSMQVECGVAMSGIKL